MKGLKSLAKGLFILGQIAVIFMALLSMVVGAYTLVNLFGWNAGLPLLVAGVASFAWFIGEGN